MTARLFDVAPKRRKKGSRALVPLEPTCPTCNGPLVRVVVDEPALFVHGGYGANRRTTTASCVRHRYGLTVSVEETNPREFWPSRAAT